MKTIVILELIIISSLFGITNTISALRYGTDSEDNDITIQYQAISNRAYLSMFNNF